MPKLYKSTNANYSQQALFNLVADVEKYPEFLPFCTKITIHESSDTHLLADMHIGYKVFSGVFQSRVAKDFPKEIHIKQTHGSLNYLTSSWTFKHSTPTISLSESTLYPSSTIEFMIDFQPSSWLVGKLLTPLMDELGNTMMQAFLNRAATIYDR